MRVRVCPPPPLRSTPQADDLAADDDPVDSFLQGMINEHQKLAAELMELPRKLNAEAQRIEVFQSFKPF